MRKKHWADTDLYEHTIDANGHDEHGSKLPKQLLQHSMLAAAHHSMPRRECLPPQFGAAANPQRQQNSLVATNCSGYGRHAIATSGSEHEEVKVA